MSSVSHCRVTIIIFIYTRAVHLNVIYEGLLEATELMNPVCATEDIGK